MDWYKQAGFRSHKLVKFPLFGNHIPKPQEPHRVLSSHLEGWCFSFFHFFVYCLAFRKRTPPGPVKRSKESATNSRRQRDVYNPSLILPCSINKLHHDSACNVFVMDESLIHKLQNILLCFNSRKCIRKKPPAAVKRLLDYTCGVNLKSRSTVKKLSQNVLELFDIPLCISLPCMTSSVHSACGNLSIKKSFNFHISSPPHGSVLTWLHNFFVIVFKTISVRTYHFRIEFIIYSWTA